MLIARYCAFTAMAALSLPLLLNAQKPAKPGGTPPDPAIAFEQRTRNGYWDLMVMDADGTNQSRLVNGGDNTTPSWSPDGEWIAFARSRVMKPGIYMVRPDGSGLCLITPTTGFLLFAGPAWSPRPAAHGKYKILYTNQRADDSVIELLAVDAVCGGNTPPQVLQSPGGFAPAWSENDVLAIRHGTLGLYVYDILVDDDGTVSLGPGINLTSSGPLAGMVVGGAAWTEDGTELIAQASFQSRPDLWVVSALTPGIAAQLTDTPDISEGRVTWSPDFSQFAYDAGLSAINKVTAQAIDGMWSIGDPVTLASYQKTRPGVARPSWRPVQ